MMFSRIQYYIFIVVALVGAFNGSAQTNEELFDQANQAYNNGRFQQAVESYEAILATGFHSEELYYNLGNSYYQLKRVGPAVYYYEKALWLDPNYADARYNLSFAENMKIDAIESLPQTQLQVLHQQLSRLFNLDTWAILTLLFLWCIFLFWGLFRMAAQSRRKRLYFGCSLFFLGLSLLSAYFSWQSDISRYDPTYAVLWDSKVQVQSEPNLRSEFLFEIHEGTKVQILDRLEGWQQIELANGSVGWVKNAELKSINPSL